MILDSRTHPEARAELDEAIAWFEETNITKAQQFREAYFDRLSACKTTPFMWREDLDISGVRSAPILGTKYRIVYTIVDSTFWVIALAHTSRKPGYWYNRVFEIRDGNIPD